VLADLSNAGPRVVVFAYHDVGYECLRLLLRRGANVVAVFSHEDNPGEEIWFHSVSALAREHGLALHTPPSVNTAEWVERIRALQPELIFSFYYRNMISEEILALAPLGAYNMHGSLLPKYRGRAPVNWAIVRGEIRTGATLHVMVKRPDAGDIVDQQAVTIGPQDTARQVFSGVTKAACIVLERQLTNLLAGRAPRRQQDESQAEYFSGRSASDGRIDWNRSASEIFNLIRAVTHPYPGAFTDFGSRRFFIWWARPLDCAPATPGVVISESPLRIAASDGCLQVSDWQWQGEAHGHGGDGHGLQTGMTAN
jgi:methionyl-tRNA formyltransferase